MYSFSNQCESKLNFNHQTTTTFFGISPPLNSSQPNEAQLKENSQFFQLLKNLKIYDNENRDQEAKLRLRNQNILQHLTTLSNDWANEFIASSIAQMQNNANNTNNTNNTNGNENGNGSKTKNQNKKYQLTRLYSFGSYRLGLISSGGDLDVLIVGPRYITREVFFNKFVPEKLKVLTDHITMVTPVPNAHIPIVKIIYDGVPVDIVYASIPYLDYIDQNFDIDNDYYVERLLSSEFKDEKTAHSLNGRRVTDGILKSIPNIETFRLALSFLKKWAKARGIYGNIHGYLSGVSLAILTARICQLYPNSLPSTIVRQFFKFYSHWKWPCPIMLNRLKNQDSQFYGINDLMPILTCAYPVMNTTFNISRSTREIILKEIKRADQIDSFNEMLNPIDFFNSYKHYLKIELNINNFTTSHNLNNPNNNNNHNNHSDIKNENVNENDDYEEMKNESQNRSCENAQKIQKEKEKENETKLEGWTGWCESRLRLFANKLSEEQTNEMKIQVYPWPQKFKQKIENSPQTNNKNVFYIGFEFIKIVKTATASPPQKNEIDLSKCVEFYKNLCYSWPTLSSSFSILNKNKNNSQCKIEITHLNKKQISKDIRLSI